ncbi:MAG: tryptophanase [Candidatus Diapherotrites archaeon]|nr:tryptophanase [Candidatus Diapherotrites archaeon]
MLSDSGTTAMTNRQWAALHEGDEAYGSNHGYFILQEQIRQTFGPPFFELGKTPNAFLFHQGRAAEDALFHALGKTGKNLIVPSNGHFDTTRANIEANGIQALDLFSPELKNPDSREIFKGNMDSERLKKLLAASAARIPLIYLTITNNTGGGQPVSMQNILQTAQAARTHKIPLFLDACRFAENAWFIRQHETGYHTQSIERIVHEMFSYADGFTVSFKKDGLVNMGGGLFLKSGGAFLKKFPKLPNQLLDFQILTEGHPTYGGLPGRDLLALAEGLKTVTRNDYLTHRITQVQKLAKKLNQNGIPALYPAGGHAIYLDMNRFFEDTLLTPADFGGIAFTALLLGQFGHRACELGNFAFGSFNPKTKKESFPEINFVRYAIPRLVYEEQDLNAVAEATQALYEYRHRIPGIRVTYGKELSLRHFKARFEFKKN